MATNATSSMTMNMFAANGAPDSGTIEARAARLDRTSRVAAEPVPTAASRRVVRQFVEALLFERLVEFEDIPRVLAPVEAENVPSIYDRRATFCLGGQRYSCLLHIGGFGRVRVAAETLKRETDGHTFDVKVKSLVEALEMDDVVRTRLLSELMQTITFCEWNAEHLSDKIEDRRLLDFPELESSITEGHLYHPCFKARTGFTLSDHRDFGPEVGRLFQLEWLAVQRRSLLGCMPGNLDEFFAAELGNDEFSQLMRTLTERTDAPEDYALLPIHPWQLAHLRDRGLAQALSSAAMIHLGPFGDAYRATQSLRTLVNVTHPKKGNIKLPLGVVCTSVPRNLRKHFVCTAPALSAWLSTLVADDPFLRENKRVILLREYAGLLYAPPAEEHETWMRPLIEGELGVIFRESIVNKVELGERAVPFTALMLVEADGAPFIIEWLNKYGVEAWVTRLFDVMLVPLWHMLVHHGIAFEAHAQNLILVHRDGWPERIALRDFHEDTEYVPDYLSRPDLVPNFALIDGYFETVPDDDGYRMGAVSDLRDLFMDTVYVFNLAELSFLLALHLGFEETTFWRIARERLDDYERSGVTASARIERLNANTPTILVESLLTKKVRGGAVLDFFSHEVPNPLHH